MTDILRFGIVGAGDAGRRHGRALTGADFARVAFVADVDESRARALAAELGPGVQPVEVGQADWTAVDAVCVCTPPSSHTEWATRAVAAGCHVLIEKPLTCDLEQLAALEAIAEGSSRLVGAVCQHRFSAAAAAVSTRLAANNGDRGFVLGAALRVRRRRVPSYYLDSWKGDPAVAGGGAVLSLGFHALDLACWWMGRPVEACALSRTVPGARVEAALCGCVRFDSGALLSVDIIADEGPTSPDEINIFTREGELAWQGDRARLDGAWLTNGPENLHAQQLAQFGAAIRGHDAMVPSVRDVKPALALVAALYESAASGNAARVQC